MLNHKTGDILKLKMFAQDTTWFSTVDSHIIGEAFNSEGKMLAQIKGSWLNQISVKYLSGDPKVDKWEQVWKEPLPIKNSHLMYQYGRQQIMLNYVSESMTGYVAPTDTRWRKDQRLYEHGKIEEADIEKYKLE